MAVSVQCLFLTVQGVGLQCVCVCVCVCVLQFMDFYLLLSLRHKSYFLYSLKCQCNNLLFSNLGLYCTTGIWNVLSMVFYLSNRFTNPIMFDIILKNYLSSI